MNCTGYFLLSLLAIFALVGCKESEQLPQLPHGISYTITKGALGNSKAIHRGNIVKLRKSIHVADSMTFSQDVGYPSYQLVRTKLESEDIKDYISQILVYAKKGDNIFISQPIDSVKKYAYVPSNKKGNIVIQFNIIDVFDNIAPAEKDRDRERKSYIQREQKALRHWLQQKRIDVLEIDGIFIVSDDSNITSSIEETACTACDTYLRYEGKLLTTEQIFDENFSSKKPLKVNLEKQEFIEGFEIATRHTPVGKTITAYIPSMLAYKESGSSTSQIPPFQNLVFTIKVEKRIP